MPAVSGTMEFTETSLITNTVTGVLGTVAELRGVPTAALSTGDLAYISVAPQGNSNYYILIKGATNADNGATVIATKEALAATLQIQPSGLPLTPPGLPVTPASTPGRWFQSNIVTLVAPVIP